MKKIIKLLPHITYILSIMIIVFFILDNFNPMMDFMNNDITRYLILALGVTSLVNSIVCIIKKNNKG